MSGSFSNLRGSGGMSGIRALSPGYNNGDYGMSFVNNGGGPRPMMPQVPRAPVAIDSQHPSPIPMPQGTRPMMPQVPVQTEPVNPIHPITSPVYTPPLSNPYGINRHPNQVANQELKPINKTFTPAPNIDYINTPIRTMPNMNQDVSNILSNYFIKNNMSANHGLPVGADGNNLNKNNSISRLVNTLANRN